MQQQDGFGRRLLLRVAALCHGSSKVPPPPAMAEMPRVEMADDGRVEHLEKFSHYVARQIGFEDASECPHLCKAANNYLRQSKNCMADVYGLLDKVPDADSLYVKLVDELERCILGYFAFHWDHSTTLITQALTVDSASKKKLRNVILEANRKQRFDRITRDLKVTRVFSTLVHEMKAIGVVTGMNGDEEAHCTDVMAPVAHSDRSPVLLLMGGGMGAGKSTVLKEILQEPFWIEAGTNALVVEADAFKETDVIYRAISSMGHHNDMLQTAELVHKSSTDAASSLLVTALNEGRDVILDGTLSWEPFVEQTIAMARAVHHQRHRMGVGYKVDEDGTITENYWEPVPNDQDFVAANRARKPYRIEVVGVVCDAYLAVARGIRRAIMTGRAVSELAAHVAQEVRGGVPEVLPPCGRGQAIQLQLLGLSTADRVEGRDQRQPAGGAARDRLPGQGEQPQRERHLPARPLPRRRHHLRLPFNLGRHDRRAVPSHHPARDPGRHTLHGANSDTNRPVASIHVDVARALLAVYMSLRMLLRMFLSLNGRGHSFGAANGGELGKLELFV